MAVVEKLFQTVSPIKVHIIKLKIKKKLGEIFLFSDVTC